jgi:tetratricopeptide (TPR) repeat protein
MAENPRIEELRRRVQLDPASIAFAALAEEFRRMGRHDDAIETCRAGLQRHPAYLSARVTLGRALIETGDYEGAREELETVLRSAPENLAAIRGLAQIQERQGHSTEMDPQLAAMMNAEVERISLAAAVRPTAAPEPAVAAAPSVLVESAPEVLAKRAPEVLVERAADVLVEPADDVLVESAPAVFVETAPEPPAMFQEPEPEPAVFDEPIDAGPDPAMLATLARLQQFLAAIDAARHA